MRTLTQKLMTSHGPLQAAAAVFNTDAMPRPAAFTLAALTYVMHVLADEQVAAEPEDEEA